MKAGLIIVLLLLTGCQPTPEPILFGHSECAYCRMIVSEPAFGSRLLTTKGKTYVFDSIECLAAFEIKGEVPADRIHSRLVPNHSHPETSLDAGSAYFRQDTAVRSPMGLSIRAEATPTGVDLTWSDVLEVVAAEWGLRR